MKKTEFIEKAIRIGTTLEEAYWFENFYSKDDSKVTIEDNTKFEMLFNKYDAVSETKSGKLIRLCTRYGDSVEQAKVEKKTLPKEVKEILSALKTESETQRAIYRELPEHEQEMWFHKLALIEEIEGGHVKDESKAKKWLEIIEEVGKIHADDAIDIHHNLMFSYGMIEVESSVGAFITHHIEFTDNKLILSLYGDSEECDSVKTLLDMIESNYNKKFSNS